MKSILAIMICMIVTCCNQDDGVISLWNYRTTVDAEVLAVNNKLLNGGIIKDVIDDNVLQKDKISVKFTILGIPFSEDLNTTFADLAEYQNNRTIPIHILIQQRDFMFIDFSGSITKGNLTNRERRQLEKAAENINKNGTIQEQEEELNEYRTEYRTE